MASTITKAPRDPKESPRPPVRADGSLYAWGMALPGHYRYAWGDELSDLVSVLVAAHDYDGLGAQEQLVARIQCGIRLQVTTQARINAGLMDSGTWETLCEWERDVLNGPRHMAPNMPHGFPSRDLFDGQDVWTADAPLVCLTTASEPCNPGVPPILGTARNLWVINPISDESLISSLEEIGLVRAFKRCR